MRLIHLTSSTFFGGPERQMLGLARAMPETVWTTFASFPEGGRSAAFLGQVSAAGFPVFPLTADFPNVRASLREVAQLLRSTRTDVLVCHGYKAHILGRLAARRAGIPAVAVSRGWTRESRKVKFYEWIDRRHLRLMDHVICVSRAQAEKVRRWGHVPEKRLTVIPNSARLAAFDARHSQARDRLQGFFPADSGVSQIVLAAGRLSPEKGMGVLLDASVTICRDNPRAGTVIFGEGTLRNELGRRVIALGMAGRVVLPGFRRDLDSLIGAADVFVLPSFTEGLPNVALEASAARVPVVATSVGGTPEVVADGHTGFLVPPGDSHAIAERVSILLRDPDLRGRLGAAGRERMRAEFTFEAQAAAYLQLLHSLSSAPTAVAA